MARFLAFAFSAMALLPTLAQAEEGGESLTGPEPGVTRPSRWPTEAEAWTSSAAGSPTEPPERVVEAEQQPEEWTGPRVELAYHRYRLEDGRGGGVVHAGGFGGYYTWSRLRIGGYGELGAREYLGRTDVVVRGTIGIGYQHLPALGNRLIPFALVEGTAGVVLGQRFSSPQTMAIRGLGLSIGADLRLVRTLFVGISLGYTRVGLGDLAHNLWVLRIRIGL